jgi:sugar fermentation stimulation protein A
MDRGIYLAVFRLTRPQTIQVGRLGRFRFAPGDYLYVGSAQRHLHARLARHARRRKTLRWQIDYLSTRTEFRGALLIAGPKELECRLAALLARHYPRAVGGFGASDCRCGGHLYACAAPAVECPTGGAAGRSWKEARP